MNKREVNYAVLHADLFIPSAGTYGKTLVASETSLDKPLKMYLLPNGDLECWVKGGKEVIVSSANIILKVPVPQAPTTAPVIKGK